MFIPVISKQLNARQFWGVIQLVGLNTWKCNTALLVLISGNACHSYMFGRGFSPTVPFPSEQLKIWRPWPLVLHIISEQIPCCSLTSCSTPVISEMQTGFAVQSILMLENATTFFHKRNLVISDQDRIYCRPDYPGAFLICVIQRGGGGGRIFPISYLGHSRTLIMKLVIISLYST